MTSKTEETKLPYILDTIRMWLIAAFVPTAAVAYWVHPTYEFVIAAVFVWHGVVAVFEISRPVLFKIQGASTEVSQLPFRLAPLAALFLLTLMTWFVGGLHQAAREIAARTGTPDYSAVIQIGKIELEWRHFLEALLGCWLCLLMVMARSAWRKRIITLLKMRLDIGNGLTALHAEAENEFSAAERVTIKMRDKYVHSVLHRLASMVQLNEWDVLLMRVRWKRWPALGSVVGWYHVLANNGKEFEIVQHAAPGIPTEAEAALKDLQERYRPATHDPDWCDRHLSHCKELAPDQYISEFKKLLDRNKFTSLAGYVYLYKTALNSRDPEASLYFDETSGRVLSEGQRKDPFVKDLLSFPAFAAEAVLANESSTPLGVIVVWKNGVTQRSFSEYDDDALRMAARVISGILQSWSKYANGNKADRTK